MILETITHKEKSLAIFRILIICFIIVLLTLNFTNEKKVKKIIKITTFIKVTFAVQTFSKIPRIF